MIGFKAIFNKNFKKVIIALSIFLLLIIVIQLLNNMAKVNNEKKQSNIVIEDKKTYQSRDTVLSEDKVDKDTNSNISNLISDFINYCNYNKIEEAYNMLSSDCKNEMFLTKEEFKDKYHKITFGSKKQFKIQSWLTKGAIYTYKVTLTEDMLSSGGNSASTIEDYYTIIKENDTYKLNINNFIGKKIINKSKVVSNINVNVKEVYIYMDYEIYNIEIKNNTNKTILLDTKEKTNTMFVTDDNNNKYVSYNYEISDIGLLVNQNSNKNIRIKFSKAYNSNLKTTKITFSDIITDYNMYKESEQKDNIQRAKVEIDV